MEQTLAGRCRRMVASRLLVEEQAEAVRDRRSRPAQCVGPDGGGTFTKARSMMEEKRNVEAAPAAKKTTKKKAAKKKTTKKAAKKKTTKKAAKKKTTKKAAKKKTTKKAAKKKTTKKAAKKKTTKKAAKKTTRK